MEISEKVMCIQSNKDCKHCEHSKAHIESPDCSQPCIQLDKEGNRIEKAIDCVSVEIFQIP